MLQKSPMYAYIPAKDVNRARKFYEKTLGLKPKEEYAGGVVYEFGAARGASYTQLRTLAPREPARRSGRSTTSNERSRSSKAEVWCSRSTTYRG
jgi:catechol 2,3-dioxygenase-like lactoylglutathione lyase family enzyme